MMSIHPVNTEQSHVTSSKREVNPHRGKTHYAAGWITDGAHEKSQLHSFSGSHLPQPHNLCIYLFGYLVFSLLEFPKGQRLYRLAFEEDMSWQVFTSDFRAAPLQIRAAIETACITIK